MQEQIVVQSYYVNFIFNVKYMISPIIFYHTLKGFTKSLLWTASSLLPNSLK